jgi:hypothetical protein
LCVLNPFINVKTCSLCLHTLPETSKIFESFISP